MKALECKGLLGHECRLAYCPRTTGTERSESGLPRNGEVFYIAVLDNRKKCDEVALDDMVGTTGRGGVTGNRPVGMRYERGLVGNIPSECLELTAENMVYDVGKLGWVQRLQRWDLVKLISVIGKFCTYRTMACAGCSFLLLLNRSINASSGWTRIAGRC